MKDLRDRPIQGFGRLEPADIYPQGERSGLSAEKVGVLASGNIVAFRDFDGEVSQVVGVGTSDVVLKSYTIPPRFFTNPAARVVGEVAFVFSRGSGDTQTEVDLRVELAGSDLGDVSFDVTAGNTEKCVWSFELSKRLGTGEIVCNKSVLISSSGVDVQVDPLVGVSWDFQKSAVLRLILNNYTSLTAPYIGNNLSVAKVLLAGNYGEIGG